MKSDAKTPPESKKVVTRAARTGAAAKPAKGEPRGAEPPPLSEDERAIWGLIRTLGHLMERVRDRELAPVDLTVQQAGILRHVEAMGDAATPSALARQMFREPTSVSALLNRMQRQGLVKRVKNLKKRNQVRIKLTEKGQRALQVALERQSARKIMARLSPELRHSLLEGLMEFRKSLLQELVGSYRESFFDKAGAGDDAV